MNRFKISTLAKTGAAIYLSAMLGLTVVSLSAKDDATPAPAAASISKGDFVKGASLWANTCQRCHNMRDPKKLDDKAWKVVVTHMRVRAGLPGQDARDVLAFLQQSNNK